MAAKHHKLKSRQVRQRAAEIRQHWSPLERAQRMGLPPDVPTRLREFILGPSSAGWRLVALGATQPASAGR